MSAIQQKQTIVRTIQKKSSLPRKNKETLVLKLKRPKKPKIKQIFSWNGYESQKKVINDNSSRMEDINEELEVICKKNNWSLLDLTMMAYKDPNYTFHPLATEYGKLFRELVATQADLVLNHHFNHHFVRREYLLARPNKVALDLNQKVIEEDRKKYG